jgi:prepilin-type N-terminal cleavage/methylation domain-containing protein
MTNKFGHRLNSHSGKRGFTLIELLVAVGVTALLVSLMLGIVVNITKGWNRSSGSLESGNQARLVLDQISSDLQAAIMRRDTNVWLTAVVQSSKPTDWIGSGTNTYVSPTGATAKLEDYRFGPYGVWLSFFSTVPGSNTSGDLTTLSAPRAVAYQILRLPVVAGSSEIRYQMFRSEVLPNLTFTAGYNLLGANYTSGSNANNAPYSIRSPERSNVIANNVVDFGVRIYDGSTLKFPVGASNPSPYAVTTSSPAGYTTGSATAIEVFVRIISVDGAQQLALFENPPSGYTPTGTWWEIVEANSRVYTRRVEIKGNSL